MLQVSRLSPSLCRKVLAPAVAPALIARQTDMQPLLAILERNGISAPDGRALHAYSALPEEMGALGPLLSTRIGLGQRLDSTARGFVLWAAERIRRD